MQQIFRNKQSHFLLLAVTILFALVVWVSPVLAGENTLNVQRNGMNSCSVGEFVTGAHLDDNIFLCTTGLNAYNVDQERVDSSTQRKGMHACRQGEAVTGIHEGKNLLTCASVGGPIAELVDEDGSTQREGMHACPQGMVVSGLHAGDNDFLCGFRLVNPNS